MTWATITKKQIYNKKYWQRPEVKERDRKRTIKRKEEKKLYNKIEYVKENKKRSNKKWLKNNRLIYNEYQKNWKKNNKSKIQESRYKSFLKIGGSKHRYAHALRAWALLVKKRDNNTCQVCGITDIPKNLHAHHFLYKHVYPNISMSLNNGITLCVNCHKEVHMGGN